MREMRINVSEILQKVQDDVKRLVKGFSEMDVAAFAMGRWNPAADILESGQDVRILVDLPGLAQSEVDVSIAGGELRISGFKPSSREGEELKALTAERGAGQFNRSFELPATVDPDKISASMRNGLLEVVLPKREDLIRREVKIDVK